MADATISPPSAQFIREKSVGTTERARQALKAFYRLRPQLSAFARVMTGNNTIIVLPTGGAPATDGKAIYIKPNLGLGDHRSHPVPQLCNVRDSHTGLLTCGACREHEEILVSLFHEIGHIIYDSFEAMDSFEKERAVERAIEEAERAGVSERRINKVRAAFKILPPKNYIEAAARISPFMPMLLNCLEDARVNDRTIKARPGMKIMFEASEAHIFDRGVEHLDGEITKWADAPPNAQALIGTFMVASGTSIRPGWLSDEVFEAMSDPELLDLLGQVREAPSVRKVYTLAFPILERLRALGYCRLDQEDDDDEEPGEGLPMPGDATPDQEDTGGDDDSEGMPAPGPSMSDPFGDDEDDDDQAEQQADQEQDSEAPDEDEVDNENGQGGSWDSEERDDLGDESEDDDADDQSTADDESDDDASASGEGDDDDDPATGDEDGACDDADDEVGVDPDDEADDDTGERDASDDDDPDDEGEGDADDGGEWEDDDEDWGDDPNAGQASGEDEGGDESGDEGDDESTPSSNDNEGMPSESYEDKGSPEDVESLVQEFGGHDHDDEPSTEEEQLEEEAIERAIRQDEYFDDASDIVSGVNIYEYGDGQQTPGFGYDPERIKALIPIDERNIQNAVIPMRKAFAANQQGGKTTNLRAGKVNARALAKRAPFGDDRMFLKHRHPEERDYHVVIGLDMSGSTVGPRLQRIKAAAYMQAELCNRVGVPFEVWGHTGMLTESRLPSDIVHDDMYPVQLDLEMFAVKGLNEPWNERVKNRLWALRSHQVNLDGHTMEFYRKRLDTSVATDKLLIYYTDGEMPNFNYNEELYILKRELSEFRKRGYAILGVGISTTSPEAHGLDTVAVYDDADVKKVVMELEKRLA